MRPKINTVTHCKLLDQERELKEKLASLYAKRAGKSYGEHGWHFCLCGVHALPESSEVCYDCSSIAPGTGPIMYLQVRAVRS